MRKSIPFGCSLSTHFIGPKICVLLFLLAFEYYLLQAPYARVQLSIALMQNNLKLAKNSDDKIEILPYETNGPDPSRKEVTTTRRKKFWAYNDRRHPFLYDAIANQNSIYFILSVRTNDCKACSSVSKMNDTQWNCTFQDGSTVQGSLIMDPSKQVSVVECQAGAKSGNHAPGSETVTLSLRMPGESLHHYKDVPILNSIAYILANSQNTAPNSAANEKRNPTTVDIAACTMIRTDLGRYNTSDADRVLEWIAYHRLQVKHAPTQPEFHDPRTHNPGRR